MRSTMMLVILKCLGKVFCFLSSFPWSVLFFCLSFCCFVFQLVMCSLVGSFPGIILNKCEQILFLLGFCVFNAVNDAIIFHWHLLHSSLSRETSSWDSTLEKKLCKRDGSGGRVSSGCPGCYLGSIRVLSLQ